MTNPMSASADNASHVVSIPKSPYYFSSPLNSQNFRVVRVAPGDWHDPIRCSLTRRDLYAWSEGYAYKALSYVWGSPKVTETIYIHGLLTAVTLNLFCALKYLRHAFAHDEDLILWVDALGR